MYILIEMQTTGTQTVLVPPVTYTDRNTAESAYYMTLAGAAVSTVNVHTVVLLDEHGNALKRDFYEHLPEVTTGE